MPIEHHLFPQPFRTSSYHIFALQVARAEDPELTPLKETSRRDERPVRA